MLDLFYSSFLGTSNYVIHHIQSDRHRKAYHQQVEDLLNFTYKSLDDAEYLINAEKKYIQDIKVSFWTTDIRDLLHSPKKYKLMACDHALDIVLSLKGRFVTGKEGSKFYYKGNIVG